MAEPTKAQLLADNEALRNTLTRLTEQQTATSEILGLISSSPSDVQPVFDAIARNTVRLCDARFCAVYRFDGELIYLASHNNFSADALAVLRTAVPRRPTEISHIGRAVREREVVNLADVAGTGDAPRGSHRHLARLAGYRGFMAIPMLQKGEPVGCIALGREAAATFPDEQVTLVKTFADQAVIAIENSRLFTELQASNRELTTALDTQTATSDILRVISRSQTDVQPVFDAIVHSAVRLLRAHLGVLTRLKGDQIELGAFTSTDAAADAAVMEHYPQTLRSEDPQAVALRDRAPLNIADIFTDPRLPEATHEYARARGWRSAAVVPMLRRDQAIGGIAVMRREGGGFTDDEIALLQTFADQAEIAIENARLLTELQDKNESLTRAHAQVSEALEQQTATAEILRVISGSPTDVQPVLDAVAESAARLCEATDATILLRDGDVVVPQAHFGSIGAPFGERQLIHRGWVTGRAVLEARAIHVPDLLHSEDFPEGREHARRAGHRATLAVPLLREGTTVGAILIRRRQPRPFSDKQIALLQTFADQAVIAIENVRLFTELQQKNAALTQAHEQVTEALEQQTATSEILRVISSSPTDIQPVFDTIIGRAVRLCDARLGALLRFDGHMIHLAAHAQQVDAESLQALQMMYPMPANTAGVSGRALLSGTPVHVRDMREDPELAQAATAQVGHRTVLSVPMMREGAPIGAITVARARVEPFSDRQVELLQTFAAQAVIAIENVRLFTELQTSNRELTTALEQQTAAAEILRVISRSPTDVQPVFDVIAQTAARLCEAFDVSIFRVDGDRLAFVAHHGPIAQRHGDFSLPLVPGTVGGLSVLEARTVQVADLQNEDREFPDAVENAKRFGFRTILSVPLLRGGIAIGGIQLRRTEVQLFSDRQVALLQTFADQAVIAIENVRLFTELQASNRELTTALDTQTATSDILRVISRSQTDVQPVFDAIMASALRLLRAYSGALTLLEGDQVELAALASTDDAGDAALRSGFPQPLQSDVAPVQVIRDRAAINIVDAHTDPRLPETQHALARVRGYRSLVSVPLLRHDEAAGSITVTRRELGGFTDDEIALLQTFADQAVIAIENARLLTELQARTHDLTRSVEQLTALGDVGRAVSSSLDLDTVLTTIVGRAVQLSRTDGGTIFEYDESAEEFSARATLNPDEGQSAAVRATRLRRGEGAVGQLAVTREPVQIPDISAAGAYESRIRGAMLAAGTRSVLAIPLLHEERLVGGLVVTRRTPGAFAAEVVELLRTFATQSALAIQNARLFQEIEVKSRELEVASQHKSEFLASMSHELRTPLNAIIGFSDVLLQGMFGETNDKQTEYLRDILASGQHLLSLINDILDLSKIEAGRMELDVAVFDLPTAIDDALLLMRERASRRGITLERHVDERVGEIRADQRKVKQVLLNLLSNAVKFTPEGGRIDVRAGLANGTAEISVTDTGIGIAPEDHDAVFEEFRQVGGADRKAEGTGLGLALCRKFVELHGGRIWVTSEVAKGSTFTFTIPVTDPRVSA